MEYFCNIADKYNIRFTVFVDATWLLALRKFIKYPRIEKDYNTVRQHLVFLKRKGYALQLHIHPHWCYADYIGSDWVIQPNHYKLSDLPSEDACNIIIQAKSLLEEIIDDNVSAFRAGGFSIQPFEPYSELFENLRLVLDSSVLAGLYYNSDNQQYDYRDAPYKDHYQFGKDICKEDRGGGGGDLVKIRKQPIKFILYYGGN
jgi:hypothetical protein